MKMLFKIGFLAVVFCSALLPLHAEQLNIRNLPMTATAAADSPGAEPPAPEASESSEAATLDYFGYNLFDAQEITHNVSGSLPDDYRLGPGDHLGIYLGERAQEYFDIRVSVDGKIFLPNVGVIAVNGMTMAEFREVLDAKLRSYFSNYSLNILLIQPKLISVATVGEVLSPGNYAASALNNVMDILSMAGGVNQRGSLRDVRVFRGDSLFRHLDLYNFLLNPSGRQTFSLQNGDKIFVPIAKDFVTVKGAIYRPAHYELNPNTEERLTDLIDIAGGFRYTAMRSRVELVRIREDGSRRVSYYDLSTAARDSARNPLIRNLDEIRVYSKMEQLPLQHVTIHGEVHEPGPFDWQQDMRVRDLILQAGGLTRSAYTVRAEVAKIDPKQPPQSVFINLADIMENPDLDENILLEPDDRVFIRRIPEWQVGLTVEVLGEVHFPGIYPIEKDSTYLSEIIHKAGGFTADALLREAKLIRPRTVQVRDREFERLSKMERSEMSDLEYEYYLMKLSSEGTHEVVIDFRKLILEGDSSEDIVLQQGDQLVVPRKPNVIFVSGQVGRPGGVLYEPGQSIRYYIKKAGGYSFDARKRKTRVIKATGEILDDGRVSQLEPGDRIWVPRKKDINYWQILYQTAMALGQVATVYLVIDRALN